MARKCGNCGEEGHNARSCSVVMPTPQTLLSRLSHYESKCRIPRQERRMGFGCH